MSRAATAKMTDEQWLRAIAQHHPDIPQARRDGALVGTVFRVSSQLESQVKEQPQRFASLVQAFPDDTHPGYFDAVLRGIAEAHLDMQTVLDVCRRCHALPNKPCGYWVCAVMAKKADLPLPPEALDMVAWYATDRAQTDREEWRTSLDESLDRHTDPITDAGRESVRGNAAEVMTHLISHDGGENFLLLPVAGVHGT